MVRWGSPAHVYSGVRDEAEGLGFTMTPNFPSFRLRGSFKTAASLAAIMTLVDQRCRKVYVAGMKASIKAAFLEPKP